MVGVGKLFAAALGYPLGEFTIAPRVNTRAHCTPPPSFPPYALFHPRGLASSFRAGHAAHHYSRIPNAHSSLAASGDKRMAGPGTNGNEVGMGDGKSQVGGGCLTLHRSLTRPVFVVSRYLPLSF